MATRQNIEKKASSIRDSYENCSVRVTDVGGESMGLEVTVLGEGLVGLDMETTLENIDRELYEEGYNTAWIAEDPYLKAKDKPKEEWEQYDRVGMTAALPPGQGKPNMPVLDCQHTNSYRNSHRT